MRYVDPGTYIKLIQVEETEVAKTTAAKVWSSVKTAVKEVTAVRPEAISHV